MAKNKVDPNQTAQDWLYYRQFGERYSPLPPPITDEEKLAVKLREVQQSLFEQQVQIADLPDRLDNPPQSLAEILQNRLADTPITIATPQTVPTFRQAIKRGVTAALSFMTITGLIFLIKSLG